MILNGRTAGRTAESLRRAMVIALLGYPLGLAIYLNFLCTDGNSIPIDFVAFWAAAKLAVQGAAASAFDLDTLRSQQGLATSISDAYFGWHYPPTFQLLITPLGWLGFSSALFVFTAASLGVYGCAIMRWSAQTPVARDLAIASPAVFFAAFTGNLTLLWIGALLTGLHYLFSNRPVLAGLCFSLLAMKPQVAMALPLALLAAGEWRAIVWALLFTLTAALIAAAVFGWDIWGAFFEGLGNHGIRTIGELSFAKTMVTWFGFARTMGFEGRSALAIQLFWSFLAGVAIISVWRCSTIRRDYKIAVLVLGTIVITPRGYSYEMTVAAVAVVFLMRSGIHRNPAGMLWVALLWLLPLPYRLISGIEAAHYAAPALTTSFILSTALALRDREAPQRPEAARDRTR